MSIFGHYLVGLNWCVSLMSVMLSLYVHHIFFRLPDQFVYLRNLTVLGLNDMSLSRLPEDFGQ